MRPMFFEYPEDSDCWGIEDQYMFESAYLVAPIFAFGARPRDVYLPVGRRQNIHASAIFVGPAQIKVACPLNQIAVFKSV